MHWLTWADHAPRRGADNMAIDVALMEAAVEQQVGFLRLYRWEPFCLSFGCHEPALRRYDRAAIEARGLDVVRRPTGGRAVWHARELTYAVAAPDGALGSLRTAYRVIHEALARAICALGADAGLAPDVRAATPDAGACFGAAAGGEVVVHGAKLVGSAQLRRDGGMLQHGSLLLEDGQDLVAELAGQPSPAAATLRAVLGRAVSWEEAAQAVTEHALPALSGTRAATPADAGAILPAAARHARFSDPAWSWRR